MNALKTIRTKVVFRKWHNGDIIALFPEEASDHHGLYCLSYEHMGQHGSASPDLSPYTTAAKPDEYAELKRELEMEHSGYVLDVKSRFTHTMHNKRRMQSR